MVSWIKSKMEVGRIITAGVLSMSRRILPSIREAVATSGRSV